MIINGLVFPFGSPLKKVEQKNRTPKKAFVLGVYASAVHAKWIGPDRKLKVAALAVASEPEIFWRGDPKEAEIEISKINVPPELGRLIPASKSNNGPSGRALDEKILEHLHLNRSDIWLCDLVPYSLANENQIKRINEKYIPLTRKHDLPIPSIPPVPSQLADTKRILEILSELEESQAQKLILLGDKPIQWFLDSFLDVKITRLANFTKDYGTGRVFNINGKEYEVFAFAHPRQIAGLGAHNQEWFDKHKLWIANR